MTVHVLVDRLASAAAIAAAVLGRGNEMWLEAGR